MSSVTVKASETLHFKLSFEFTAFVFEHPLCIAFWKMIKT